MILHVRKRAGKGGRPPGNYHASGRPRRGIAGWRRRLAAAGTAVAVALLAAACSGGGTQGKSSTTAYLQFAPCCSWGSTWSFNMYNPLGLWFVQGLVVLPLAMENYPSLTSFTPQVADSWSVSGNALTIQVRPGMKWQNGKPVTSTDVYDTIVLDGTNGSAGWLYISGVSAPNPREVVVTARPGTNMVLLEDDLLTSLIYPASTYGPFMNPGLEQDDVAYYAEDFKNPAAAATMPQYAAMQAAFKKFAAYNVPTLIGDGPFTLKAIDTSEALLVKWPGFYDASSVHIAGINYSDNSNQTIYPQLLSGGADFSDVSMAPSILKQWQETPGSATANPPSFPVNLVFNSHAYPLNMTAVRQAIAYVIPRSNMVASAYGGNSVKDRGGVETDYPDGLPDYLNSAYLTPSEIASLNPYPVNDAKAASLLQSAGFHKSGGNWIMPNGRPFTLSFLVNSAWSDVVASFTNAASALSAFGIGTNVDATDGTTVVQDTENGNFQVSMMLIGGPDPLLDDFDPMLGPAANFETLGQYAGKRGLGFGPKMAVPGLGTVDVPSTIEQESEQVGPGPQMNQLTYDWARLVNQQLPYLTYDIKMDQFEFSSKRFTDWPPMNAQGTSPLWNIMSQDVNQNEGLTLMLEEGYIRPTS
jgi:peptide/nickel transport system substrate-binding protein